MESTHPFSVSFAPCFQAVLCRSQLFFRMFLDKLFQICADRFIMKQKRRCFSPFLLSPSSRRAWIEIPKSACMPLWCLVALLAEGVDRNITLSVAFWFSSRSPSSRRAWIEIFLAGFGVSAATVALLAEGVDRNNFGVDTTTQILMSPSSRRAWIEMVFLQFGGQGGKSPSSRRAWIEILAQPRWSANGGRRPPRGGRG